MLENTQAIREAIKRIALALGQLNEEVVYVGGSVVGLYVDDPSAEDVRATKDIDFTVQILSIADLENLRESLIEKGFYQSHEDDVQCRFRYEDLMVDVMATKEIGWAPGDPWFEAGFEHANSLLLDEVQIRLLPLPYYLATKFSAFYDRGGADPRASHDFEDIVYLLNNASYLVDEIKNVKGELRDFLKRAFQEILKNEQIQEAIFGNLYYQYFMHLFTLPRPTFCQVE